MHNEPKMRSIEATHGSAHPIISHGEVAAELTKLYLGAPEGSWTLHEWEDFDSFCDGGFGGTEPGLYSSSYASPGDLERELPVPNGFLALIPSLGLGEERHRRSHVLSEIGSLMRRYVQEQQDEYEWDEGCRACQLVDVDYFEANATLNPMHDHCQFQQWPCCSCGGGNSPSFNGTIDCPDCGHLRCNNCPWPELDKPDIANE